MKKRIDIEEGTLLAFIIFIVFAIFFPGTGPTNYILAVLSVATFLFGIIGAYILQNRHERLNEIRDAFRISDALLISLYLNSEVFGKKIFKEMHDLLDNYIIATFDYKLVDYSKSGCQFLELFNYIKNIRPKKQTEKAVYDKLLDTIMEANKERKKIETAVRNTMLRFEWLMLYGLLAIILLSIFWINDNSLASVLITVLLSTSSVILLFIIRDLESLLWKEQKWIWDPSEQTFYELDLLPYYPFDILKLKRVELQKGKKIRVAYYPNPYPDISGKIIKIEDT